MIIEQISDADFVKFQKLIFEIAGISMTLAKKALVTGRLSKRLRHYNIDNFNEYYRIVTGKDHPDELQIMVDLLTTNETYFFREDKHFDYIKNVILPAHQRSRTFRVWSAASSTGEEAYSTAMLLSDQLGMSPWEIVGSDISTKVLKVAETALYRMEAAQKIPNSYLNKYCLKGVRTQAGWFLIDPKLRKQVTFRQINLMEPLPGIGTFDIIFLRNIMIYFDDPTKTKLIETKIVPSLNPGGYLFIGHSETLNGITDKVKLVVPAIYRKPT